MNIKRINSIILTRRTDSPRQLRERRSMAKSETRMAHQKYQAQYLLVAYRDTFHLFRNHRIIEITVNSNSTVLFQKASIVFKMKSI